MSHGPTRRLELARTDKTFTVPAFGPRCVCCNADAMGRTQTYDPSTSRVQAEAFEVPVCHECRRHALQTSSAATMQVSGLAVGGGAVALALMYLRQRPDDSFLKLTFVIGALISAATVIWIVASIRRARADAQLAGHHPGLVFSVGYGRALLDTSNDELANELLALNPTARELPTPVLWKSRVAAQLPQARVTKQATPPSELPPPKPDARGAN